MSNTGRVVAPRRPGPGKLSKSCARRLPSLKARHGRTIASGACVGPLTSVCSDGVPLRAMSAAKSRHAPAATGLRSRAPHAPQPCAARPRISTQLYIAIVLTVAVGLAGLSIKFAGGTIAVAQRIQTRIRTHRAAGARGGLLAENRRLVDAAMLEARQRRLPPRCRPARQTTPNSAGSCKGSTMRRRLRVPRRFRGGRSARQRGFQAGARRRRRGAIAASRYATSSDDLRAASALSDSNGSTPPKLSLDRLGAKARVRSCGYSLAPALPAC